MLLLSHFHLFPALFCSPTLLCGWKSLRNSHLLNRPHAQGQHASPEPQEARQTLGEAMPPSNCRQSAVSPKLGHVALTVYTCLLIALADSVGWSLLSLPDALIMPGVLGASGQRECLYVQGFVAQSGIYTGFGIEEVVICSMWSSRLCVGATLSETLIYCIATEGEPKLVLASVESRVRLLLSSRIRWSASKRRDIWMVAISWCAFRRASRTDYMDWFAV